MLELDVTQADPSYYQSWMTVHLPRIQEKVNDKNLVMGSKSIEEVEQALLSKNLTQKVTDALNDLLNVLTMQQEYYSLPVRSDPTRGHEGPIVDEHNCTTRPLYLLTQADGRVLNRFDQPCNWVKTATGNHFLPLTPKPVVDLLKYI
jgi:hypothetical protein